LSTLFKSILKRAVAAFIDKNNMYGEYLGNIYIGTFCVGRNFNLKGETLSTVYKLIVDERACANVDGRRGCTKKTGNK